ncbi:MAG: Gfo/Idh/MocA family oxidoreductase, partial [Actinomycetota bacterium]|nr:Gfo/Idh/MocA family oxidoreductase [Actinomycetota bacterium]
MRLVLVGAGAVGARTARQLHTLDTLDDLVITDRDQRRASAVAASLGRPARSAPWDDALLVGARVLVITAPAGSHRSLAERALEGGVDVVSASDDVDEVTGLLDLDAEARERNRSVVVGAGFSPGLTCLLARHAAADFSAVDEIHVAKAGTGGPACARQHHGALAGEAIDWRDGAWVRRAGGSGRELCWFPDPVGGLDCYRAALPDALLLRH